MPNNKQIHIFGGGTFSHVRNHLSLAAPAFGGTAKMLTTMFENWTRANMDGGMDVKLHLTRMADPMSRLTTNDQVTTLLDAVVACPLTKIVVFNCAMVDFAGHVPGSNERGKHGKRLSSAVTHTMDLIPADKVIDRVRRERKDIFLVAFKTTTNASPDEQFQAGLALMKRASCNLVVANDVVTGYNMIITPEEARYAEGVYDRQRMPLLRELVDMTMLRSQLTFTRSTVVAGEPIAWDSPTVPAVLREVVDHCIRRGAYKRGPTGATVGHFACKIGPTTFLTSRRKVDFNRMAETGLVMVETDGDDSVIAYGSKPSVGGQSQRILFQDHPGANCVVHFHCPLRDDAWPEIPVVSQREYECGSHQCGENTSRGIKWFGNVGIVMLDKHGPNLIFDHETVSADEVLFAIERNFDLSRKTT